MKSCLDYCSSYSLISLILSTLALTVHVDHSSQSEPFKIWVRSCDSFVQVPLMVNPYFISLLRSPFLLWSPTYLTYLLPQPQLCHSLHPRLTFLLFLKQRKHASALAPLNLLIPLPGMQQILSFYMFLSRWQLIKEFSQPLLFKGASHPSILYFLFLFY